MPNTKKKRLTDVLTIRGKTTTDSTNDKNQNKAKANADMWDAPANKVPRDVSPDMHEYFSMTTDTYAENPKQKMTKLEKEMRKRRKETSYPTRIYDKSRPNNWL